MKKNMFIERHRKRKLKKSTRERVGERAEAVNERASEGWWKIYVLYYLRMTEVSDTGIPELNCSA